MTASASRSPVAEHTHRCRCCWQIFACDAEGPEAEGECFTESGVDEYGVCERCAPKETFDQATPGWRGIDQ